MTTSTEHVKTAVVTTYNSQQADPSQYVQRLFFTWKHFPSEARPSCQKAQQDLAGAGVWTRIAQEPALDSWESASGVGYRGLE